MSVEISPSTLCLLRLTLWPWESLEPFRQVNYQLDSIALEPDETFRLTLTVGSGLPSGTIVVDSALFTIIDDDGMSIGVQF